MTSKNGWNYEKDKQIKTGEKLIMSMNTEEKDTLNFFLMIVAYYILLGLIMSGKMRWVIE